MAGVDGNQALELALEVQRLRAEVERLRGALAEMAQLVNRAAELEAEPTGTAATTTGDTD